MIDAFETHIERDRKHGWSLIYQWYDSPSIDANGSVKDTKSTCRTIL